ncbi:hypothetical protein C5167_006950 [Papaver somniferum]|uniref:CASP-like protein n=1 Tax=Papaver somniferum TaxID=3469 RepID=A0A4Y7JET3_PAPSO|nr:CASP-like protein 1F1 [Papaver somniferum]RZC59654.1 hypothetical protein C5167_006950 [Papaver somniferum]
MGSLQEQIPFLKIGRKFIYVETPMRVIGIISSLISIVLMVTYKQVSVFLGVEFVAKYSYSPAFKYFVVANGVACFFSTVSLFLVKPCSKNPDRNKYFIIFMTDLVATVFSATGCAAATSFGYTALHGNEHTGWMKICDQFKKFCHRSIESIVLAYFASLLFLFLTIWSAWKSSKLHGVIDCK